MQVRYSDGRPFAGVGIVPDTVMEPTAQDLADGVDTELTAAIAALKPSP